MQITAFDEPMLNEENISVRMRATVFRLSIGLVVFLAAGSINAEWTGGEFRAACVKVDITPDTPQWLHGYGPRKSTGVHDKIYHRIVAMDDGSTQFFLVSTDVATISPSFHDEVCRDGFPSTDERDGKYYFLGLSPSVNQKSIPVGSFLCEKVLNISLDVIDGDFVVVVFGGARQDVDASQVDTVEV